MKELPQSILDEPARKITTARRLTPILYLVSEDREIFFDLLQRGDCFDVQRRDGDGNWNACAYGPPFDETLNLIAVEGSNPFTDKRPTEKQPGYGKTRYYYLRDFAAKSNPQDYFTEYIKRLDGLNQLGGPLTENLIIVSPVAPYSCIPTGFEQFVEVINIPLIGMWEIAGMAVEEQNRALQFAGRPPLELKAFIKASDPYLEKCKGLNRRQVRYVLRQLAEQYGWVSRVGVLPEEAKHVDFDDLTKTAEAMIYEQKRQMVLKDGTIDFLSTNEMDKPGGMEGLCTWIAQKKKVLDDPENARRRGEKFPKGILIAGLPGSGKSMTAKYIARELNNMPLIQFKLSKVLTGIVGGTEERLDRALKLIEAVAPCVVWIDEIEKELSGTQGSGDVDAGVASRCLATLLHWMQEDAKNCFICATANRIDDLPSELLRRGRFDRKYYTFLPLQDQCADILEGQLRRIAEQAPELFSPALQKRFPELGQEVFDAIGKMERKFFTGADVEGLLQDAKSVLFQRDEPLPYSYEVLRDALVQTAVVYQPYGETNFQQILEYWAALKTNPFLNAAVPETQQNSQERYSYMLFDFSDFVYDGKAWKWNLKENKALRHTYDKKMFQELKTGIERYQNDTTRR